MKFRIHTVALILTTLGLAACAGAEDTSPVDGRDEVAVVGGKADNFFGACGGEKLLDLLNDARIGIADLKEAGVHTRAAQNVVLRRNGPDQVAGTPDDVVFESLEDVDAVPYVGPVAMNQLAGWATTLCVAPEPGRAEVIFSPQPYGESHLARVAELIEGAQRSVDIAMYSFSDGEIMDAIEDAVARGVDVRMVFEPAREEARDPDGTRSDELERAGVDVRYINKIMHHKFAIIDGPREVLSVDAPTDGILVSGSGNWSYSAGTRYDENTVITFGSEELNLRFQREFNHMWRHSRDFDNGASLPFYETDTIDEAMIVDDPSVDAVFTSANFKTYVSSRYGETFSVIRGRNEVADTVVEHIERATTSIWIASGHLRSRPISEALLRAHEANPDLDIRVYLDGQEYVSEYTNELEKRGTQECLVEAGDSESRWQDCLDKDYHYSFDVDRAGIDLRFKYYAYRWHYTYAEQMHHKYMIIDGARVLSGSYNYSDNAEHNTLENMVVYEDAGFPGIVRQFEENFLRMWDTGRDLYDGLVNEIASSDRIDLVFEPMALTWSQVRELKQTISASCPEANSYEFRREPERHQVCYR